MLYFSKKSFIAFFVILYCTTSFSQSDWVDYIIKKEHGLMSVSIDLDYGDSRPNYKNLLIVGTSFKGCLKNGFPKKEGLKQLYTFSDSIASNLDGLTKNKLVGIITYQCMGLDVYYVKDTLDIRNNFNKLFKNHFNESNNYLRILKDKNWSYYWNNIYPIDISDDYFLNQDFLIELVNEGDNLTGTRKVEHWVYHNNLKKRAKFIKNIQELNFSIDSVHTKVGEKYPYELLISRRDSVHPKSINKITSLIKMLVYASKGIYGGWATELKIENELNLE